MVSVIRDILFFFQDIKMLCLKFLLCILLVWGCKNFIKLSRFFSTSRCFVFFKNKCIYLFIYFWLRWVFVAARGLSLVVASRGYSLLRCAGFALRWLLLWSMGSRHAGFSSCGARAQLLHGTWDLPGPGLKPVSPALTGRFLTTAPPGKSFYSKFYKSSF